MQQRMIAAIAAAGFMLGSAGLALAAQQNDPGQYSGNGSAKVTSSDPGGSAGNGAAQINNGAAWGGSGGNGAAKVDNGAAWGGSGGNGSAKAKQ